MYTCTLFTDGWMMMDKLWLDGLKWAINVGASILLCLYEFVIFGCRICFTSLFEPFVSFFQCSEREQSFIEDNLF